MRKIAYWIWCGFVAYAVVWAHLREDGAALSRAAFEERHRIGYDIYAASDAGQAYDLLAAAFAGKELDRQYGYYARASRQLAEAGAGVTVWDLTYQDFRVLEARGDSCRVRSKWTVFFVLGHSKHSHIRGNVYEAEFEMKRVGGEWKIVGSQIVGDSSLT